METVRNFIGGKWVGAAGGGWLEDVEPATGAVYARLPASDTRDAAAAVAAAREAFPGWAATPAGERARLLLQVAALIEGRAERLARAESIDTGKPIALARRVDVPRAAQNFRFFATAVLHTKSACYAGEDGSLHFTLRAPRGVAGCLSPWNLPLYLFTWKVAPALATGNTVVGKPSELTPMTAHLLTEIVREAGLPPGVFNVVHGRGPEVGHALVVHPDVPTLTFTGGTATGAAIARAAAPRFKRVALELGGKNPTLVFADADFEVAVRESVRGAFTNQGQVCLCGSRVLVEATVYDRFLEAFVGRVQALRLGDPLEETTEQGALVSREHRDKVARYVALARAEGGKVLVGGRIPPPVNARCRDGFFYEPTVITGLDMGARVNREEIFGPVVTVLPFRDEAEAV